MKTHVIVLYVLVGVLALGLILSLLLKDDEGTWQCSNVVCAATTGPEVWVANNCFQAAINETDAIPVCRIVVNGQDQFIPLDQLNLTNLRVCTQYACVQEVRVRQANYSVNAS